MRIMSTLLVAACLSACGSAAEPVASSDSPVAASEASIEAKAVSDGPVWDINFDESQVGFIATQQGEIFEGKFEQFEASISLDPDYLESAVIHAVVFPKSVDAQDQDRNAILPTKDWFHIKQFPEAVFHSESIVRLDDGNYEARGDLTIKGITKETIMLFGLDIIDNQARAVGELTINRSDFNVGEGSYATDEWIDFMVNVSIEISATQQIQEQTQE